MMPEESPGVWVRCLPEGAQHAGASRGLLGNLLQVELADAAVDLAAGALVEVNCNEALYLGQVYNLDNGVLTIGVEHVVDPGALSAIRDIWSRDRH